MKRKAAIKLTVYIVIVAVLAVLALTGFSWGIYDVKSLGNSLQLGLDLTGGVYVVYQADSEGVEDFDYQLQSTMTVFRTRLDSKGYTEATITQQGADKIRIEIPINSTTGIADPNEISKYVGTPAQLEFRDPNGEVILTGDNVTKAGATVGEDGSYAVSFELDADGTQKFSNATTEFLDKTIGIYLDDAEISAPKVESAITGGQGQITGDFTREEALNLAMQIESGALPLNLNEIEARSISATLGANALDYAVLAGVIGLALVMLFMLLVYRIPGLAADMALVAYLLMVFGMLVLFRVQLTLPGIAGIILGIGMAVDANIIIFERFKEEYRWGKTLRNAFDQGFKQATRAIVDANITTLIAVFVLIIVGTGSIKGFAYALLISIVASLISAMLISRFLTNQFTTLFGQKPSMFCRLKPASANGMDDAFAPLQEELPSAKATAGTKAVPDTKSAVDAKAAAAKAAATQKVRQQSGGQAAKNTTQSKKPKYTKKKGGKS